MKKIDRDTLDTLRRELSDAPVSVPESLSKENVVSMLREGHAQGAQASDSVPLTPARKPYLLSVRRVASLAASLIIVFACVAVYGRYTDNIPIFSGTTDTDPSVGQSGGSDKGDGDDSSSGSTVSVATVDSYDEIEAIFAEMRENSGNLYRNSYGYDDMALPETSFSAAGGGDKSVRENVSSADSVQAESGSHGTTYTQVDGVDEADILKNDGKYLYKANGRYVDIVELGGGGTLSQAASLETETAISEIYVRGDMLAVIGSKHNSLYRGGYYELYDYAGPSVHVELYNLADRSAPEKLRSFDIDGSYVTSRFIGGELYIVGNYYVDIYSSDEYDCVPSVTADGERRLFLAGDVCILERPTEPTYLVVCGIDTDDPDAEVSRKAVLGGGSDSFCTSDSLFVSRTVYEYDKISPSSPTDDGIVYAYSYDYDVNTEIYRFSLDGGKVDFDCSGTVEGTVLNQFSMDYTNGFFRIATTSGQSWDGSSYSTVSILNSKLENVGSVTDIAEGEMIYAARFIGDTAYLVTFEQTDPLFVIDLSNPKSPKILGELKLPGFSNYLLPVGENLLLGVGHNGDDDGMTPGVKLSLFYVGNPSAPKEISQHIIEGNVYTEAWYTHKAMLYRADRSLLGIPVKNYDTGRSAFMTFTVNGSGESAAIAPSGSYGAAHGGAAGKYYDYRYDTIRRGTYVGDTVYTVSDGYIDSFASAGGPPLASVALTSVDMLYGDVKTAEGYSPADDTELTKEYVPDVAVKTTEDSSRAGDDDADEPTSPGESSATQAAPPDTSVDTTVSEPYIPIE